jgi:hypothetical protein
MKDEIEVLLTKKIPYSKGGESLNAESVLLTAPSARDLKETTILKQSFFQAIASLKSQGEESASDIDAQVDDMTGDDVLSMMFMSNVDMNKFFDSAKSVLKKCAKLDGVVELNDHLIDELNGDDFEKLVGEFLINFILASTLKKMKRSS